MRNCFLNLLYEQMKIDDKIFFLTADMGINLVEKFEENFPDRFLNVGIAEQNLIGVAAGLAESGMKPFAYTISNFLTQRCFEQIRNDVVLHDLPITLVGTSTGFDNAQLGPTHHMLDDWGVISALPKIKIGCPYSLESVKRIFEKTIGSLKPIYIRIPKGPGYELENHFNSKNSSKEIVVTYGSAIPYAMKYSSFHNTKLFATEWLGLDIFNFLDSIILNDCETITIIEDHFPNVGLYSYACQWKNLNGSHVFIKSIAPKDYQSAVGLEIFDFIESDFK
jgi:transketolase